MIDLTERIARTHRMLEESGLDAVVCRLNHNVLMLTGYWPLNGLSVVVVPRGGKPILLMPEQDTRFGPDNPDVDVRTFLWGDIQHLDPLVGLLELLRGVASECGLTGKRLAMEFDYPIGALPVWMAEIRQWTAPALAQMQAAFGDATWTDAWAMLAAEAARKTPAEIAKIRIANKLGGLALMTFRGSILPGRRECEVAAAVEAAVQSHGPGTDGVRFARAFATVMSGPNGQYTGQTYNISTDRALQEGDLVSLELGLVADGYWTDLTRVHAVGQPTATQLETFDLAQRAHEAGVAAAQPGGNWRDVDAAARGVIEAAGRGADFPHVTGHGLGFCYHEPQPILGPPFDFEILPGQVVTIEPGVYNATVGAMRLEDNYLVTESGVENLSPFDRSLAVG